MSFLSYADRDIQVNGLKDDLIKLRLQGPLSHPVLLDALQVAEVISTSTESADQTWWEKFYAVSMLLRDGHDESESRRVGGAMIEESWGSSPSGLPSWMGNSI